MARDRGPQRDLRLKARRRDIASIRSVSMKITEVTPLLADGGCAPYAYVKFSTNAGITGDV